jgi:DNA invertase Pin-like site-specific DNA recombinase
MEASEMTAALSAEQRHLIEGYLSKTDEAEGLWRMIAFIATLMERKVDFVCCDMPEANRLTIHIIAAMAEHERNMISDRTKRGLAAARERGVKLGGPKLPQARKAAQIAIRETAERHAANVLPIISDIQRAGARTLREIAVALNARGIATARGGQWHAMTVRNVLARKSAA